MKCVSTSLAECSLNGYGKIHPMISAGTHPFIRIDLGNDEPGMILQRLEGREWVDYIVDGEIVKSPVDIDALPAGKYRLV
jgi:hypothetical protein